MLAKKRIALTRMILVLITAGLPSLLWAQTPIERPAPPRQAGRTGSGGAPRRESTHSPRNTPPEGLEIIAENGQRSKIALEVIRKTTTENIARAKDKEKAFTPLLDVMKAAGIPSTARIRVKGNGDTENEMVLQHKAPPLLDPLQYGFVFNKKGFVHLTPKPGPDRAEATPEGRGPQVKNVISIEVVRP